MEENFVGANRELQQILETEDFKKFIHGFAIDEELHFIPPRFSHFGGIWELAVRFMKLHLKRTLDEVHLTVGEMTTILAQVETVLNSRPITPLSKDPRDLREL